MALHETTGKPCPGDEPLDAVAAPAVTGLGWTIKRRIIAGQGVVSPLPGDGVGTDDELAIDHQAATTAGAEDDAKHHPARLSRPVDGLREGETVGVIGEPDRLAQSLGQVLLEVLSVEKQTVGILDATRLRVDRPGQPDADGEGAVHRLPYLPHQICDGRQEIAVPRGRGRDPPAQQADTLASSS